MDTSIHTMQTLFSQLGLMSFPNIKISVLYAKCNGKSLPAAKHQFRTINKTTDYYF